MYWTVTILYPFIHSKVKLLFYPQIGYRFYGVNRISSIMISVIMIDDILLFLFAQQPNLRIEKQKITGTTSILWLFG